MSPVMSAVEILEIALGKKNVNALYGGPTTGKIAAIKEIRTNGMRATCSDYYPSVALGKEALAKKVHVCYDDLDAGMGLKEALDFVNELMAKVEKDNDLLWDGASYNNDRPRDGASYNPRLDEAFSRSVTMDTQTSASERETEKRLGKALRQIEGLREKLADRNAKISELALRARDAETRVRHLETLIADQALSQSLMNW